MRRLWQKPVFWALAVAIFGFGANAIRLGAPGVWQDEVATLVATQRSWRALATMLQNIDAVHGTYYALMKPWINLVGYFPVTLRLPSVLGISVAAGVLVLIGARWWGRVAGALAGIIFLALPRTAWMAVEGRSFALNVMLLVLALYALVRFLEDGKTSWLVGFGVLATIAMWVFLYSALAIIALALAAAVWLGDWRRRGQLFLVTAISGVVCLPLAWLMVQQKAQVDWIPVLSLRPAAPRTLDGFDRAKTRKIGMGAGGRGAARVGGGLLA